MVWMANESGRRDGVGREGKGYGGENWGEFGGKK